MPSSGADGSSPSVIGGPPRLARPLEAVRGATGHDYEEWFALLDASGADARGHGAIAAWVMDEHGIDNWWAQTITVQYERARGMRPPGGGRDGRFTVSASKTVAVPVARLYSAFADAESREPWLPAPGWASARSSRGARLASSPRTAPRGSTSASRGRARPRARSPCPRAPARRRGRGGGQGDWRERLAALKALLES